VATFLELCGKVARESGAVGSAPASVADQTGRQGKVVEWVRQAWEQIQTDQPDWLFLRGDFDGALAIGVMEYAPATFGIDDFTRWLPDTDTYQPMSYYASGDQANEKQLSYIPYERWRSSFNRGVHDPLAPVYWSFAPNRDFLVGPKPDAAYVIRGEYQRGAQTLEQNDDEPIMPTQYHDAIVWRACMMLAEHDEADSAFVKAGRKYAAILLNMSRDLLPPIEVGGNALA
jgi:hypothetical protein